MTADEHTRDTRATTEEDVASASVALARLACPYYRGTGAKTCVAGCFSEPSCITDQPPGGWAAEVVRHLGGTPRP